MSETIQGSKSSNYIKDQVPGVSDSSDSLTHQSVQNLWNGRGAADVLIHGLYKPSLVAMAIEVGSVKRKIKITAHGASEGDFLKIVTGASAGEEIAVVKVVDANTIVIAKEINVVIGDSIEIWRAVTPAYNADGSLNVSVVPSPIQYNRKAAGITAAVTVLEDLDTPSASKPMPVSIHSVDGAGITVNAGDLSVSINHVNDSVAIGDGTTLAGVTVTNELKVSLPAAQIATLTPPAAITNFALETGGHLASLDTKLPSQGQALAAASIPVVLTAAQEAALTPPAAITGFSTLAEQQTQTTALGTLDTSVNSLLKPASTLNKVSTVDTITNTVTVSGTVTANAGTNLNTSALALESGGNLASVNTKIPSNLTVTATRLLVDGSGVTQPVSIAGSVAVTGPLTDTQLRASSVPVSASSLPLPTGAATSALQSTIDTSINTLLKPASTLAAVTTVSAVTAITNALPAGTNTLGSVKLTDGTTTAVVKAASTAAVAADPAVVVAISPNNVLTTKAGGKTSANAPVRNDYSSVSVTTAAFTQLVASLTSACTELEIFDSSGQTLALATGAAASEVIQVNIFPGGNGRIPLAIAAGTRVSIKALSATASVGEININFYN